MVSGEVFELAQGYYIHMCLDKEDSAMMDMTVWIKMNTWLGLSNGTSSMDQDVDMLVLNAGTQEVSDKYSLGY